MFIQTSPHNDGSGSDGGDSGGGDSRPISNKRRLSLTELAVI